MNRLDGAPSLPIKDEVDLAVEARAKEILRDYDVTPEEAAQMARADIMKNMDQSGAPTPAGALARQHQQAGASPEQARRLAEDQVRIYGPQGAWGLSREYGTPEGMERLTQAKAEGRAADARHQKMYDDYFTATNAPSHQRVTPETQRQWDDTGRYVAESRRIREAGLHPNTPVDPGTPEQGRRWERFLRDNPEEMAKYRPDEFAAMQAAEEKQAWADKRPLLAERYGEDEVQKMEAARQGGKLYVPSTSSQRDRRDEREKIVTAAMQGDPDARDLLREEDSRRVRQVARPRMLRELGLTADETSDKSDDQIRKLLREKREADKQAKDLLWRPRTMARAGNSIGAAALPGMNDWQQQRMAGGPTPLGVQAAQAAGAGRAADADVRLAALQAQMEEAEATRQQQAQQFQERMQAEAEKRETDRQLASEQNRLAAERLTADNKRGLAEIDARLLASKMEMEAKLGATNAAVAEKEKERLAAEAAAVRARQMAWQQQEPGLFDIASGRANTRPASTALKALAATSDRFQWLPGGGFGLREATAMNEELLRIAAQAQQLGVQSPLADPEYRRKLIMQYGYSSGWSGGRGGWFGDFWQPMPEGLE